MLLPDQPSDEREGGRAGSRGWSARRPSRDAGRIVVLTAGPFVVVTLVVVWLWSGAEPACDSLDVATFAPACEGDAGHP